MSIDDPNGSTGPGSALSPELKDQVTSDAAAVADKARHDLDAVAERATDDVRKLGEQASEKLSEATGKVKSFAGDQKDMAAGQINGIAAAITKVADELDGSEQPTVARYARDLASGLSNVGKTIEERDVDDLMGLAQDFGRQQPLAFLGAAALAGFVASRFALASAHRRDSKSTGTTYGSGSGSTSYGSGSGTSGYDQGDSGSSYSQETGSSSYDRGYNAGQRVGGQ